MSSDAKWLLDMFKVQMLALKNDCRKRMHPDKFEKISACAWAISEVELAVNDYTGYISVSLIREILRMFLDDYKKYYSVNRVRNIRFLYASQMIQSLLNFTDMYIETKDPNIEYY